MRMKSLSKKLSLKKITVADLSRVLMDEAKAGNRNDGTWTTNCCTFEEYCSDDACFQPA